jgi:hypothetical protein
MYFIIRHMYSKMPSCVFAVVGSEEAEMSEDLTK